MATKPKKATKTPELRGKELARTVINHILDHPEEWDQKSWHCGTTHCFFGHCQVRGGKTQDETSCYAEARDLLGISEDDAAWLSDAARTLPEIHGFVSSMLKGEDGFDRDGFDRAGFDRAGFDRAGFDRAGFDRAGFDRAGFNRAGFDRAGFDRAGFDRDGKPLPKL